jgi:uncharacterized Tic20 family protein
MNDSAQTDPMLPVVPSNDDRNLAMLSHLLGIFTGFVGALIVWLIKKDESGFVGENAREALNFQITMVIAYFAAGVLSWILIGLVFFPLLFIANIIFCIMGAVAASKGAIYRYPLAIRLLN